MILGERARNQITDLFAKPVLLGVAGSEIPFVLIWDRDVSRAGTHYNLACAYAQWSEEFQGRERETRRQRALAHLSKAVENQWSDIGWMDEDRDLEPIRDTDVYRHLAAKVRRALKPPGD